MEDDVGLLLHLWPKKCSKTSKPVQHARLASLFHGCSVYSFIHHKSIKVMYRKSQEDGGCMDDSKRLQLSGTFHQFHFLWTDGCTVFVLSLNWLQTKAQLAPHSYWSNEFDSLHIAQFSVFRRNIYHTLIGNSHALTVFDALPRLVKQIPFLSTTNMWWKIIHISKPQTQSGIIIVILKERVQKQN